MLTISNPILIQSHIVTLSTIFNPIHSLFKQYKHHQFNQFTQSNQSHQHLSYPCPNHPHIQTNIPCSFTSIKLISLTSNSFPFKPIVSSPSLQLHHFHAISFNLQFLFLSSSYICILQQLLNMSFNTSSYISPNNH